MPARRLPKGYTILGYAATGGPMEAREEHAPTDPPPTAWQANQITADSIDSGANSSSGSSCREDNPCSWW